MRTLFLLMPVLALAACSQEPRPDSPTAERTTQAASVATPAAPAVPASPTVSAQQADPTASPSPVSTMPAAMQGRWGMTANDCDPARSDAKGLMVVGADTVRFYESQGTLQQAEAVGDNAVRATLGFTGEGMAWETQDTFTLSADNATLTRRSVDRDGTFGPFAYRRCS